MTYFVNVYELDRHFGGPEEGGWWFNSGSLVSTEVHISEEAAHRRQMELYNQLKEENNNYWNNLYSVGYRGGAYEVSVDYLPGADYPTQYPRYE